ncbi:hypothetical protein VitviT2T_030115 [Vitis vinifera]|uniref:Disease resistance R13L4/SHOC-2-like LRR domain-containing protein n=1 Tax=Vitis vinifera TaxID=29760 RepID=A0ABY9E0T3_VITVI|nr:hypothetical protein VitviT2T_030115 [Vitis vinifera]
MAHPTTMHNTIPGTNWYMDSGFVEEKRGKTLKEVADAYLDELINGCLVDANKRDFQGVIKAVSSSVEKIQNLETLELRQTFVSKLPKTIRKLHKLVLLLVDHQQDGDQARVGAELFSGIGGFYHQYRGCHLSRQTSQGIAKELGNLTAMRKLAITELERKDGKDLCASIQKMKHLSSLLVISISEEEVLDLGHLSAPPHLTEGPQKSSPLLKVTIGRPEFVTLVFLGLRVAMGRVTSS